MLSVANPNMSGYGGLIPDANVGGANAKKQPIFRYPAHSL